MGEPLVEGSKLEKKALSLINLLLGELFELDHALKGKELPLRGTVPQISSLEDEVELEEVLLCSVMPLGLAAFLLYEEEKDRGGFFLQCYNKERETLRARCRRGRRHKIRRCF